MILPLGLSLHQLFGLVLLVVGALVLAIAARYVWRTTAVLRAKGVETIDSLAPGTLIRAEGTIDAIADPIEAPFSGINCAALRYRVEERRLSLTLIPCHVTIHERSIAVPFDLRTVAGSVSIPNSPRTVTFDADRVVTVSATADPPARVAAFHRRVATAPGSTRWRNPPVILERPARMLGLGSRRYVEQRAAVGEEVTVVGRTVDRGIDPIVLSDRPPTATFRRMARTSLAGLSVGAFVSVLGIALLLA